MPPIAAQVSGHVARTIPQSRRDFLNRVPRGAYTACVVKDGRYIREWERHIRRLSISITCLKWRIDKPGYRRFFIRARERGWDGNPSSVLSRRALAGLIKPTIGECLSELRREAERQGRPPPESSLLILVAAPGELLGEGYESSLALYAHCEEASPELVGGGGFSPSAASLTGPRGASRGDGARDPGGDDGVGRPSGEGAMAGEGQMPAGGGCVPEAAAVPERRPSAREGPVQSSAAGPTGARGLDPFSRALEAAEVAEDVERGRYRGRGGEEASLGLEWGRKVSGERPEGDPPSPTPAAPTIQPISHPPSIPHRDAGYVPKPRRSFTFSERPAVPRETEAVVFGLPRGIPGAKDSGWIRARAPLEAARPCEGGEVLLATPEGRIVEGLITNFFTIEEGTGRVGVDGVSGRPVLRSATSFQGAVWGTMRHAALAAAWHLGWVVADDAPVARDRGRWREAFLTSATRPVQALRLITCPEGNHPGLEPWRLELPGDGGPLTRELRDAVVDRFTWIDAAEWGAFGPGGDPSRAGRTRWGGV